MGTNFYYKIPVSKRQQEHLHSLISSNMDLEEFEDEISAIKRCNNIHLGKRSFGWQFLWDYNIGKYYQRNLQSIKDFLNNGGGHIEDEYGRQFTVKQFLEKEIPLYKDDTHCDAATYVAKHPEDVMSTYIKETISEDGLRFANFTDFS